eukprot:SAG11_NODE_20427_length_445_cov_1.000000_1_plen_35_part_10
MHVCACTKFSMIQEYNVPGHCTGYRFIIITAIANK